MAQQTTSTEFDDESRLRISSFFSAFGWRSGNRDREEAAPPPPERAPKIDETIAEFDASVPVWLNHSVRIETGAISIFDHSNEPPVLREKYEIDQINKIAIPRGKRKHPLLLKIFITGVPNPVEVSVRKHTAFLLEIYKRTSSPPYYIYEQEKDFLGPEPDVVDQILFRASTSTHIENTRRCELLKITLARLLAKDESSWTKLLLKSFAFCAILTPSNAEYTETSLIKCLPLVKSSETVRPVLQKIVELIQPTESTPKSPSRAKKDSPEDSQERKFMRGLALRTLAAILRSFMRALPAGSFTDEMLLSLISYCTDYPRLVLYIQVIFAENRYVTSEAVYKAYFQYLDKVIGDAPIAATLRLRVFRLETEIVQSTPLADFPLFFVLEKKMLSKSLPVELRPAGTAVSIPALRIALREVEGFTALNDTDQYHTLYATHRVRTGKVYFEVRVNDVTHGCAIGWAAERCPAGTNSDGIGDDSLSYSWAGLKGLRFHCGGAPYASEQKWKEDDVIGTAYDADKGIITYYRNGVNCGVAFENARYLGGLCPAISLLAGASVSINLGPKFRSSPSGYVSIQTLPMDSLVPHFEVASAPSSEPALTQNGKSKKTKRSAKKEKEETSTGSPAEGTSVSQCQKCHTRPADALLLPCKHQVTCMECAQWLVTCPKCRKRLTSREKASSDATYLSSTDSASLAASLLLPPPASSQKAMQNFRYWFGKYLLDKDDKKVDSKELAQFQAVGVYVSSFVYVTPDTNPLIQSCLFGSINDQFQLAASVKNHQRVAGRRFQLILCTTDATQAGHEKMVKLFLKHNPTALIVPFTKFREKRDPKTPLVKQLLTDDRGPSLPIFDEEGVLVTRNASPTAAADIEDVRFPWPNRSVLEILSPMEFIDCATNKVSLFKDLRLQATRFVLLFTTVLDPKRNDFDILTSISIWSKILARFRAREEKFEVLLLCPDKDADRWAAVTRLVPFKVSAFECKAGALELLSYFCFSSCITAQYEKLPTVFLIDQNGKLIDPIDRYDSEWEPQSKYEPPLPLQGQYWAPKLVPSLLVFVDRLSQPEKTKFVSDLHKRVKQFYKQDPTHEILIRVAVCMKEATKKDSDARTYFYVPTPAAPKKGSGKKSKVSPQAQLLVCVAPLQLRWLYDGDAEVTPALVIEVAQQYIQGKLWEKLESFNRDYEEEEEEDDDEEGNNAEQEED